MLLGLDISTSITGFTILDHQGEIIRCDAWDMRNKNKFKKIFDKASFIKDDLLFFKAQYPINSIYIEQPFMFFNSGGSSAKTMASLQRFNGIISWICYDIFGMDLFTGAPNYITASQARKACGIKVKRGEKAKKVVMKWLLDNEDGFSVEYTKKGNPKPKYYDIADSIVIAKAGHYLSEEGKKYTCYNKEISNETN
tara:strand:- start:2227 stop:2814 length:588 start_codon:yes stop_codon:yes gene_type:complete